MAKDLFATLDDIEWSKLRHSYDTAEDIPQMLRDLIADDEDSNAAFDELFEMVWHPESLSEATVHTIPFVIEIIEKTQSHIRSDLLILLKEILSDKPTSKQERELFQKVSDAARKGIPVYLGLIRDEELQSEAIDLLSAFPDACDEIAPHLLQMLDEKSDATTQYILIEALFALTSKPKYCSDRSIYHTALRKIQESEIKALKLVATTALIKAKVTKPDDEAFDIVKDSIISPENYVLPRVEANPLMMNTIREDSLKILKRLSPEKGLKMMDEILASLERKGPQVDTAPKTSDKPSLFDAMQHAVKKVVSDIKQDGLEQFEMDKKEDVEKIVNLQSFMDNIASSFLNFNESKFNQFTNKYASNDFGIYLFFMVMYFGFGKDLRGEINSRNTRTYPTGEVGFEFSAKGENPLRNRQDLSPIQLQAIKTISKYDQLWTFKNNLLEINGLPKEREALRTFIDSKM